jgi:hypothetical protein
MEQNSISLLEQQIKELTKDQTPENKKKLRNLLN